MYGRLGAVKMLVYEGILTNAADCRGSTPLHYAAFYGEFEITKFLSTKSDLNPTLPDGRTPIMIAALCGHKNIVNLLIEAGADLSIVDKYNWSLLHISSYKGWIDVVYEIVNYHKNVDLDLKTMDGYTALWLSAYSKEFGIFQLLVHSGADTTCTDAQGWTLLHCAARSGKVEMVKSVLGFKGIDFEAKTASGDTALFLAMFYNHKVIGEILIRSGIRVMSDKNKNISLLHDATRRDCLHIVNACIEMGFDVHVTDNLGDTPLHVACTYGHSNIIRQLLASGADCLLKNKRNRSPFNNLVKYVGNVDLIDLCLRNGAYFLEFDVDSIYDLSIFNLEHKILRSARMWTTSYINEYNNKILPSLYKVPAYAELLPPQNKLEIKNKSGIILNIWNFLTFEKKQNRDADLSDSPPIVLKILAAKALLAHENSAKRLAGRVCNDTEPKRKKALSSIHALELFLDNRY